MDQVTRVVLRGLLRWARSTKVRSACIDVPISNDRLRHLLSTDTVRTGDNALDLIRRTFRQAGGSTDIALLALREANEASQLVDEVWNLRQKPRDGVKFGIGEVFRHASLGYRCVVVAWDRRPIVDVSAWENVVKTHRRCDQPFYRVLPDARDSLAALGGHRDVLYVAEDNLLPCGDKGLVHSMLPRHFRGFLAGAFIPSEPLAFMYPKDRASSILPINKPIVREADDAVRAVRDVVRAKLAPLQELVAFELDQSKRSKRLHWPSRYGACAELVAIGDELDDLWLSRTIHRDIKAWPFELGSTVRHKLFGYAGVVVGFDRRPTLDVRKWDGVRRSQLGVHQPFLHVVDRDQRLRYVAAENLLAESKDYGLPAHAEHDVSLRTLFKYNKGGEECEQPIIAAREQFIESLPSLRDAALSLLAEADFQDEAGVAEKLLDAILVWAPEYCDEARIKVLDGVNAVKRGDTIEADDFFDQAALLCPNAADPHHNAALSYYHASDFGRAAAAARRALALDPDHVFARGLLGVSLLRSPFPDLRDALHHLTIVNDRHPFTDTNFYLHKVRGRLSSTTSFY